MAYRFFLVSAVVSVVACGNSHGSGSRTQTPSTSTTGSTSPPTPPPPAPPPPPQTIGPPGPGPDPTPAGPLVWDWEPKEDMQPGLLAQPAPTSTNAPPDPVVVGGPPATCQVYENADAYPLENDLGNPQYPMKEGSHQPENSVIPYTENPPTSGPNYEMWAQYKEYDYPLLRPHWVHNLRHGAIVLLYRPDAPTAVVQALREALAQIPRPQDLPQGAAGSYTPADPSCPSMGLMAPDNQLLDTFVVLAYRYKWTSNCVPNPADIVDFARRHMWHGLEFECFDGAWPIRAPCYRYEDAPAWSSSGDGQVPEGTPVSYQHDPPTTGPFYDTTLKYGRYDTVVPVPYWMGILAKGGVVVLYRPDAPASLIAELQADYDALPVYPACGRKIVAMVQNTDIKSYFAYVSGNSYMGMQCTAGWSMAGFVTSRQGWGWSPWGPNCSDGSWVPAGY